jgi:hypothetical protein
MDRRIFLLWSVTIAALVACGDPSGVSVATDPTTPQTSPATTPSTVPATIAHPTGPDEAVLELQYQGGLMAPGGDFASVPYLVVSGDGRIFTPAPASTPAPGPLMENIRVRQTNEDGLQKLLDIVARAGLLATPPEYPDRHNVADAPNTMLTINAGGGTFVHSAYGLGIGDPETGARKTLSDAVTALSNVDVGAGNIDVASFVPTAYRLQARVIDPQWTGQDLAPMIVDWPASAGVSLATASECARVDAAAVGSLFHDAQQNTFFREAGVVYALAVRGVLPGDPTC